MQYILRPFDYLLEEIAGWEGSGLDWVCLSIASLRWGEFSNGMIYGWIGAADIKRSQQYIQYRQIVLNLCFLFIPTRRQRREETRHCANHTHFTLLFIDTRRMGIPLTHFPSSFPPPFLPFLPSAILPTISLHAWWGYSRLKKPARFILLPSSWAECSRVNDSLKKEGAREWMYASRQTNPGRYVQSPLTLNPTNHNDEWVGCVHPSTRQ